MPVRLRFCNALVLRIAGWGRGGEKGLSVQFFIVMHFGGQLAEVIGWHHHYEILVWEILELPRC